MGERRSLQSMAWRARLPITDSARRLVWDTHLIAVLGTGGYEMEGTCVGRWFMMRLRKAGEEEYTHFLPSVIHQC